MAVRAAARSSGRCSRRLSAKNREESFRVDQRLGAGTRADPRWSLGEVGRARSSGRPHLRNVSLLQLGGRLRREARGAARGVRGRERKDGGPSARRTVRGRWRVRRNWKWGPAFRRGADEKEARWRKRKWGPALLPAPTAPSEGYAGVRNLVKTRRSRPAFDPGSPAQASLPIEQLPPKKSLTCLPDCASRGFAGLSTGPAKHPRTEVLEAKTVRLSAALLGSTTLASRFASPQSEDRFEAASRLRKIDSSGASSRLTPLPLRRASALPAGGDRTFGHLPHRPVLSDPLMRPGPPSRSLKHHALRPRVGKAKNSVRSLWITWISVTTVGTFSKSLFGCRSVLPALPRPKCLNRLPLPPNLPISGASTRRSERPCWQPRARCSFWRAPVPARPPR